MKRKNEGMMLENGGDPKTEGMKGVTVRETREYEPAMRIGTRVLDGFMVAGS